MDKLEEITVIPKVITDKQFNTFNTSKILKTSCIIIVILIIFFFINNIFSPFNDENNRDELKEIEKYVDDCNKGISYDQGIYTNIDWKPQISVIIPVYNASKLIKIAYRSILNQSFKKVEIIFVNDLPSNFIDNDMIKYLQENDKRIVLVKNKKNRGAFFSRSRGVLLAKGKYIQFLDVDDLLVNNILEKSLNLSEKNDLDVVQFSYVSVHPNGKKRIKYLSTSKGIIYQPEIKDIMCYRGEVLNDRLHKFQIWDKIIKKDVFLNALRFIGDDNIKERFSFAENILSTYAVTSVAQSLINLNEPGYYHYVSRNGSISEQLKIKEKSNQFVKYPFKIIKIVYDKEENNTKNKRKALCFFRTFYYLYWAKTADFLLENETREIMVSVSNMLINSIYLDDESKDYVNNIRNEIYSKIERLIDDENLEKNPSVFE